MHATLSYPQQRATPRGSRVLLAEDNELLRRTVQGLLRRLGHSVDVVSNGREAVEAAACGDYGLVLLDIQMPEMGGFEAARSILDGCRGGDRPRIVGLSADGVDGSAYEAAGMDDYLIKPIFLEDLVRLLSRFRFG